MQTVIVNGAQGKMGSLAAATLDQHPEFTLVAALGKNDNLRNVLRDHPVDIVVDFTNAAAVFENAETIIEANIHPVIGTTGLKQNELLALQQRCKEKSLGGLVIPNFSIAAVLMMQFAAEAARYLPAVEIIEMHHDGKLDSPSGTAIKTADMIAHARTAPHPVRQETATLAGARGANYEGVPIHAVRLRGLVADQEVIFGAQGETLSIAHRTTDRSCFMPGVVLACQSVGKLTSLIYGLESLLA